MVPVKEYPNVHILDHPMVRHKVAIIRDVNTDNKTFRETITELSTLLVYECLRNVPSVKVMIQTPFECVEQEKVKDDSIVIVPILRAGLGMVDGVFRLFSTAKVGHIGMKRNEETLKPVEYYCNLPEGIAEKLVIILDPMLATGGTSSAAIDMLKKKGCRSIRMISVMASPEGVEKVAKDHTDVEIYISALDRCLNDKGYILPGLGDAGDRIFGTD